MNLNQAIIAVGLISLNTLLLQQLPTQAQNLTQNSQCASTLESIKNKITKGRRIKVVDVSQDDISTAYHSYPKNRPFSYMFVLKGAATESVLRSDELLTSFSKNIFTNCSHVSQVVFGMFQTDYLQTFGLVPGNETTLFKCIPPNTNQKLPWGYVICT